jgi:Glycosyltransferase family 87
LILLVLVCVLAVFAGSRSLDLIQGADFPHFYCAARMLADGHGRQLFDADVQRQYQARYAGRVGTLYTHPPFEAVLYLAVAWLPLRYAFVVWSCLSIALLALSVRRIAGEVLSPWSWRVSLAVSLTFVPVLICVLQGQDSLLLLLLSVLAFTDLRRGRGFAGGCWLALGLFKFQVVLPLVLVLVLTQSRSSRSGLAKGFGLTALALAGVSVVISGWSVLTLYPDFLVHFREQPLGGIAPQAMANFRGLICLFFNRDQSDWAIAAELILSAGALITTLIGWMQTRHASQLGPPTAIHAAFDLAFSNTVFFALLVSYHLNPHDLALALLPISLLLHRMLTQPRLQSPARWMILGLLGILFLPPLHLWALKAGAYDVVGIPVLLLFLTSGAMAFTTQGTSPRKATTIRD